MIKAVMFDFGGVLCPIGHRSVSRDAIAQVAGIDYDDVDTRDAEAKLQRGDIDPHSYFAAINAQYGTDLTVQKYIELAEIIFQRNEEVFDLAKQLRQNGIQTGVWSNVAAINAHLLRDRHLYDGFEPVVLSCDIFAKKPEPAYYEQALKAVTVPPNEILFIDDQRKCLDPASARGVQVLLAESPGQVVEDVGRLVLQQNGLRL